MRIISIDVGIKNLAYCILEGYADNYKIIQWDVINLCGSDQVCNCVLKTKVQKGGKKKDKVKLLPIDNKVSLCNKKASFLKTVEHTTHFFCQPHAKISDYILPNKSLKNLKSWKRDALLAYVQEQGVVYDTTDKKDTLIKNISDYVKAKVLEPISNVSANDLTLIQMGIKLVKEFDKVLDLAHIDQIVIENQISPIANRMKTLQGMIAQYFIMREKTAIAFISSANKLKVFSKGPGPNVMGPSVVGPSVAGPSIAGPSVEGPSVTGSSTTGPSVTGPNNYGERKKEGVKIVKDLLTTGVNMHWQEIFLNHKKKDDMADAFLQGAWFLSSKIAEPILAEPMLALPILAEPILAEPMLALPILAEPMLALPILAEPILALPILAEPILALPMLYKDTHHNMYIC